eukprot:1160447-Pelagomonas_calceolata.AAC.3
MAAGQPFNASSPTPPSHLSTDRVAIPPPHKPAPPKPSPVNQGAGPFALQHKAAAPPAPSPAPLPGISSPPPRQGVASSWHAML